MCALRSRRHPASHRPHQRALAGVTVTTAAKHHEEFAFGGELEEKSQKLEDTTNSAIEQGQDLDLDLSFLKDALDESESQRED